MARGQFAVSAQQLDPLSWFTGRVVPLVFAGLVVLYSLFRIPTWLTSPLPWLQPIGVAFCAGACVFVFVMTRPLRPQLGWAAGIVTVLIAATGVVISSIGYGGVNISIELWWAPFGFALAISSLAPYLSARRVLVLGGISSVIVAVLAFWLVDPDITVWGPLASMVPAERTGPSNR